MTWSSWFSLSTAFHFYVLKIMQSHTMARHCATNVCNKACCSVHACTRICKPAQWKWMQEPCDRNALLNKQQHAYLVLISLWSSPRCKLFSSFSFNWRCCSSWRRFIFVTLVGLCCTFRSPRCSWKPFMYITFMYSTCYLFIFCMMQLVFLFMRAAFDNFIVKNYHSTESKILRLPFRLEIWTHDNWTLLLI